MNIAESPINFIIGNKTVLQYYLPIAIECHKRKIQPIFYYRENKLHPYWNPALCLKEMKSLCHQYQIPLYHLKDQLPQPGITFLVEGDITGRHQPYLDSSFLHQLNHQHIKVVLPQNCDYCNLYQKYIHKINYIVFPSPIYLSNYRLPSHNPKNLYLGHPKYDFLNNSTPNNSTPNNSTPNNSTPNNSTPNNSTPNNSTPNNSTPNNSTPNNSTYQKYQLPPDHQYVLIFFPKIKFVSRHKTDLRLFKFINQLFDYLHQETEFKIIVKSRTSSPITNQKHRGDYYFEDTFLYPNESTELLTMCQFAFLFSSTANEECVMTNTPYIDIQVDNKIDRFSFLNHPSYSKILNLGTPFQTVIKHFQELLEIPPAEREFEKIRQTYFPDAYQSSQRILDVLLNQTNKT